MTTNRATYWENNVLLNGFTNIAMQFWHQQSNLIPWEMESVLHFGCSLTTAFFSRSFFSFIVPWQQLINAKSVHMVFAMCMESNYSIYPLDFCLQIIFLFFFWMFSYLISFKNCNMFQMLSVKLFNDIDMAAHCMENGNGEHWTNWANWKFSHFLNSVSTLFYTLYSLLLFNFSTSRFSLWW